MEVANIEYLQFRDHRGVVVKAMVERLFLGLQLDRSWRTLSVVYKPRLRKKVAQIIVQFELLHAKLEIGPYAFESRKTLYEYLVHEFVHLVQWPLYEATDMVVSHIAGSRRRSVKRLIDRAHEHINEDLAQMIKELLPWNEDVEKQLGFAGAAEIGEPHLPVKQATSVSEGSSPSSSTEPTVVVGATP